MAKTPLQRARARIDLAIKYVASLEPKPTCELCARMHFNMKIAEGLLLQECVENDRLIAAIRRIADIPIDPRPDGTHNMSREALIHIARRALKPDPKETP